jgi:acetylornithine deacetylase
MMMRPILERLIGFDTVSAKSNLDLVGYVQGLLAEAGIECVLIPDTTGAKANLYAVVGPEGVPGVILSGHVDVVPVEGQVWTKAPFALSEADGRFYGRGVTDMKGFVACAIAAVLRAGAMDLKVPVILALSHDEEIGCQGVPSMLEMMAGWAVPPRMCLVGEPTSMQVATGHKGKIALRATCTGREMHSAMAPLALNALHLGAEFLAAVRDLQAELVAGGPRDDDYDVPYTTLHVGKFNGGVQVNMVPKTCVLDFEIRSLAGEETAGLIARLGAAAEGIVAPYQAEFPEAAIVVERLWDYPGLGTSPDADVVAFAKGLVGGNGTIKVPYGTEGGMFAQRLGVPTVICGPGNMAQGHTPDEFIEVEQLARCEAMLDRLLGRLVAGF